ncbi:alcohol dehydrogenase catalytic domain-containing protein [Amycolatopsis acidicola]|uniref:Alcohol dehydrogenase catalytic domain-containing protein n=1 Tax=Amycolatopsis acidicola TaxID=2596893 RepID=A0A5N0UTW2_9PSEU|nr:alcohol dehydrogenase catalytic domain-containing protein [Amycolatopsis acidicola]KAA9154680.1 alcohol dehydrogenase catalytic domain-containing protein [Amycolatopsis acidicola]
MKALIKTAPGNGHLEWADRAEPAPGPGEVVLELTGAGLCHTDLGMIHGAYGPGSGYSPSFPMVLGHEYTGRIAENGAGTELPPGSRVVGSAHLTCGRCAWCDRGRSMLCDQRRVLGLDVDGVYAERFVVPERNLAVLPPSVPDRLAVLAEPFAVAAHAVDVARLGDNEKICVLGPGTVGLLTLGALAGREVTVVGRSEDSAQVERARELGATEVATTEIEALHGKFDVVFETAGTGAAVTTGTKLLGRGGRLICVGLPAEEANFSSAQLAWNEQSIIGSRAYDVSTWESVPSRLAAAPGLESIVTHTVHLSDHERALELVESRQATKVLLHS